MDDGGGRAAMPSPAALAAGVLNPNPMNLAASFLADHADDPDTEFRSFGSLMTPACDSPTASAKDKTAQSKDGVRAERGGSFAQRLAARGATSRFGFDSVNFEDDVKPHAAAHGNTKLSSRAPFSRSSWLTIPPGLSPTLLLDSPLLFSNYQAEPSPTTGSYNLPSAFSGRKGAHLSPHSSESSKESDVEQESSSGFVFKPLPKQGALNQVPAQGNLTNFGISPPQFPTQFEPHGGSRASGSRMLSSSAPAAPPNAASDLDSRSGSASDRRQGASESLPLAMEDMQGSNQVLTMERPSEDGYNWRKYGQKQVKGSEFPRSYYKCTYANCPVKKKVERCHDGQVTEIVYKGEHNHIKPVPSRRLHGAAAVHHDGSRRDSSNFLSRAYDNDEGVYADRPSRNFQGGLSPTENGTLERMSSGVRDNFGSLLEPGGLCCSDDEEQGSRLSTEDGDEDGFNFKRRRIESLAVENAGVQRTIREPRVVVQTPSEIDILDDGYRWRKYGQKVVKGNPHPRSYYKCTNVGCPVRKHVERASNDPKSVITTYEGKHNHDVPVSKASAHDNGAGDTSLLARTAMFAPCVDNLTSATSSHDQANSFPAKSASFEQFPEDSTRDGDIDPTPFFMDTRSKAVKQEAFSFSTSSLLNFADVFPSTEG